MDFLAGCGAGMVGLVVGHPLDTIRVHQQTRGGNIFKAFRTIYRCGGAPAFFRGMTIPLFANGIISGIFFASFEQTVEMLLSWKDHMPPSKRSDFMNEEFCIKNTCEMIQLPKHETYVNTFIAGCVAGFCQSFVVSPVELTKIQLQTASRASVPDNTACIKRIYAGKGIKGFALGYRATIARDVYSNGVFMCVYKLIFDKTSQRTLSEGQISEHPLYPFFAGGAAGMAYWTVNMPLDVIKSKIQAQDPTKPYVYKGIVDCGKTMYRRGGLKSFYPGYVATIVRGFPVNGITLCEHEISKEVPGKLSVHPGKEKLH
ncbi:unnamed protein product [Allacma fusca]|uniref:Mitochondrial carrier protein n=1 Tax=Allacma fusca TaxID=39272 RepID=A0A8J2LGX4_9HEXA|nr:unnamed protein product [Allacma fusca]